MEAEPSLGEEAAGEGWPVLDAFEPVLMMAVSWSQVIGSLQVPPTSPPASDEIAAFTQQQAESLRTKIIINRVCRRFTPLGR